MHDLTHLLMDGDNLDVKLPEKYDGLKDDF